MIKCNLKSNEELIKRILFYDEAEEEFLPLDPDGTLHLDIPIDADMVKRIDLLDSNTHVGSLYYHD